MTSSTLTDGALCPVFANRDVRPSAAMPATSPPTIAPATSTVPTETHQRMAALPSFTRMVAPEARREKRKHGVVVHIAEIAAKTSATITAVVPAKAGIHNHECASASTLELQRFKTTRSCGYGS